MTTPDPVNAWIETEPGRRFRLQYVSSSGDILSGSLRFVLDDWPAYVDVTEFMSHPPPVRAPGDTGFYMWEVKRPRHHVQVNDGVHQYECTVSSRQGDQVTCYVTAAVNLLAIRKSGHERVV